MDRHKHIKDINQLRNMFAYEDLSEWKKFLFAYRFTLENLGITALWRFPMSYYKLWKMAKK